MVTKALGAFGPEGKGRGSRRSSPAAWKPYVSFAECLSAGDSTGERLLPMKNSCYEAPFAQELHTPVHRPARSYRFRPSRLADVDANASVRSCPWRIEDA
jgi:hypothetical protein